MTENSPPDRFASPVSARTEPPTPAASFTERLATDPELAQRYGIKHGMSKWRKITLALVGFALLCGLAVYIGVNEANPKVQAVVLTYSVNGNAISLTFEVDKPANARVECTLEALDIKGNVIGTANVAVPADGRGKVDLAYTVNTTGTPNTAEVTSCSSAS